MEGMGTITYESALINVEFLTYTITGNECHCEIFIADAYVDGHARSGA